MKDITRFPHASATMNRKGDKPVPVIATSKAFNAASSSFAEKYKRLPDYDIVRFRGFTSTTGVTIEIWEEE